MNNLFVQAISKFLLGVIIIGLLIFLPAGSLQYWQGWLLMGILFVPMFCAGLGRYHTFGRTGYINALGEMDYIWHYESPLGGITLGSDGTSIIGLWFDGQMHFADVLSPEHEEKLIPVFKDTCRWLDIYFSGSEPGFTPPLVMRATPFRKAVWEIMLTIPYGKTMTYGEIAKRIAERKGITRMAAQAVGGAVGHNTISLIIPCHRVVGKDSSLTGYAGGIDRKINLLRMEGALAK